MKKIALIFILLLSICQLFSCGEEITSTEAVFAAEEKMKNSCTKMTVEYEFLSDNRELVDMLRNEMPVVQTTVDGDNSSAYIKMADALNEGEFVEMTTTVIGNKVYINANGEKRVVTCTPEELEGAKKENLGGRVDILEIYNIADAPKLSANGDVVTITFDTIKNGESILDFAPQLEPIFMAGALSGIRGEIVINDGAYERAEFSFDLSVGNISVTTKMIIKVEMGASGVEAPLDAEEYIPASFN